MAFRRLWNWFKTSDTTWSLIDQTPMDSSYEERPSHPSPKPASEWLRGMQSSREPEPYFRTPRSLLSTPRSRRRHCRVCLTAIDPNRVTEVSRAIKLHAKVVLKIGSRRHRQRPRTTPAGLAQIGHLSREASHVRAKALWLSFSDSASIRGRQKFSESLNNPKICARWRKNKAPRS